jgi:hypothetical protein
MSKAGPADEAESAVRLLVDAIREALACGIKCTDASGSSLDISQVDKLCEQRQKASACIEQIQDALFKALEQPEPGEEGVVIQ